MRSPARRYLLLTALLVCAAFAASNDYSNNKAWLCRPGQPGACDADLTTTVIAADGKLSRETWTADANAPIDCFYVYPTVSTEPTPNSDMIAGAAELNVIRQQFARFGSKCRRYAPLYRQITLVGLAPLLVGRGGALDRGVQYDDVLDAWNYYLQHDNKGRGFVLIGHSQGSYILTRLLREEIDGKPIESRMVSAILPGATIAVAKGRATGGAFQHIPLCRAATQTGCVIAYSSFRANVPPPAATLFGRVTDPNLVAACTNPAALNGGSGELHAYFATARPSPWVVPQPSIATPWVTLPGLLTAQCTSNQNATYLEITTHGDPAGPRTDTIEGDILSGSRIQAQWGLHLVDVNLAIGNLIDIVGEQAKAYLAKK
jgi:hypothetical protein